MGGAACLSVLTDVEFFGGSPSDLQAARDVADHMVLTPDGFDFAPYPMLVETDREKYAVQRIVSFYFHQPTDFTDYFQAAWRYRYRVELGKPNLTLASVAADAKISPKYLPMVWQILHDKDALGPVAKLQGMWNALPVPGSKDQEAVRAQCIAMRDFTVSAVIVSSNSPKRVTDSSVGANPRQTPRNCEIGASCAPGRFACLDICTRFQNT